MNDSSSLGDRGPAPESCGSVIDANSSAAPHSDECGVARLTHQGRERATQNDARPTHVPQNARRDTRAFSYTLFCACASFAYLSFCCCALCDNLRNPNFWVSAHHHVRSESCRIKIPVHAACKPSRGSRLRPDCTAPSILPATVRRFHRRADSRVTRGRPPHSPLLRKVRSLAPYLLLFILLPRCAVCCARPWRPVVVPAALHTRRVIR